MSTFAKQFDNGDDFAFPTVRQIDHGDYLERFDYEELSGAMTDAIENAERRILKVNRLESSSINYR